MSNFSFSHSVFYPFGELSAIFIKFEIVVCKLSQVGSVQNLSFGKGLTPCQKENSGLVIIETTDLSFAIQSRLLMIFGKKPVESIEGKEINSGNQHFFLFPKCFLPYQGKI